MMTSQYQTENAGSPRRSTAASTKTSRRRARRAFAASVAILLAGSVLPTAAEAVTISFKAGATPAAHPDLSLASNYSSTTLPDATTDVRLLSNNYALALSAATLTAQSLDISSLSNTSATVTYSIQNYTTSASNSTLLLGNGAGQNNTFAAGSVAAAAGDLVFLNNTATGATIAPLTLNILGVNGSTGSGTLGIQLAASGNFNTTASTALNISAPISGAFSINKTGTGSLSLSGNNTFTGFTATNGTTTLGSNGALGGVTSLTLAVNGVVNYGAVGLTNVINDAAAVVFNGAATATTGGVLNLAGSTETIGSLSTANPLASLVIGDSGSNNGGLTVGDSTAALTFAGVISGTHTDGVSAALTKQGSGTLTLSGKNTFTGGVAINGGILSLGIGQTTGATPSDPLGVSGTISFGGGTLQYSASATVTPADYSGRFSNAANQAYSIDTNTQTSVTFASNLTSQGGTLTKLGAGNLLLSGQNTFTGAVNINAGGLRVLSAETVGVSGPLGQGGPISFNGGSLQYSVNNTYDYSPRFSNAAGQKYQVNTNSQDATWAASLTSSGGTLTKVGIGTLTLSGQSTFSGSVNLNGGVIALGGAETAGVSGPLGQGGTIFLNGGTLQFSTSNNYDYSPRFSTAAGQVYSISTGTANVVFASNLTSSGGVLTKLGTGMLSLSGANTYTGGTTVSNGTLQVSNSQGTSATGSGAVTVAAGATLQGRGFIDAGGNLITINGTLSPGSNANPVGTIRLSSTAATGALTLSNTSTLAFDITDGTTKDLVFLNSSTLALNGGTLALNLPGSGFDYTGTYALFTGVSGLTLATPGSPFSSITGYDSTDFAPVFTLNGTEYDLSFSAIATVPEPSGLVSCAALSMVMAGAAGWRGRGRVRAWLVRRA